MTLMPVVEYLRGSGLIDQGRGGAVNGIILLGGDRPAFIHRVAGDVENAAHHARADGHGNGRAGVEDFEAALEAFGAGHGDGTDPMVAQMLLHFEGELGFAVPGHVEIDRDGVVNGGEAGGEFDIHDRPDDLDDFAFIHFMMSARYR